MPAADVYAEALAQTAQTSGLQAVVFLADPLQPAQMRAWLRRRPPSQAGV
jgi:phage terminase large subunit-like protein